MADYVEVKLAARRFVEIEVGEQNRRAVEVWTGEYLSKRVDDATSPSAHHCFRRIAVIRGIVCRVVAAPGKLV